MMTAKLTCGDALPLLAPYADGSLAGHQRASVSEHLLGCARCRATAEAGRQAHELLRSRASDLETAAPRTLKEHVAQTIGSGRKVMPKALGWRLRWAPMSAAAVLALAVLGVVAIGSFAPRGTVLAAQLGLDHLKCLWLAERHHGADPERLASEWAHDRGWTIAVPPSSPPHELELVALRRCLYGDGEMAHLVYERGATSLSLFILPRPRDAAPELEIMGLGTVAWTRDGRTYALVGDAPAGELAALAAYMRPLAR